MAQVTDEERKLLDAFKALQVMPKADSPEDLKAWIREYSEHIEEKPAPQAPAAVATAPITITSSHPRLSIFYGNADSKGEATYEQWIYEVRSLVEEKTYKTEVIMHAIRRSLRGEAFGILMRLHPGSDIKEVIRKFESVYGLVESRSSMLAKFYGARQADNEDVTAWTCRLEELLNKLIERNYLDVQDSNEMLCDMFWTGLRQSIKDISGYKFEHVKDFDKLRVEVRRIEQDHKANNSSSRLVTLKRAAETDDESTKEMKHLRKMMATLTTTVAHMDKKIQKLNEAQQGQKADVEELHTTKPQQLTYREASRSRYMYEDRNAPTRTKPPYSRDRYDRDSSQARNRSPYREQAGRRVRPTYEERRQPDSPHENQRREERNQTNSGPVCYRCRERGHFQWQCRVRMDHSNQLN